MVDIEGQKREIARTKEILRTAKSPYVQRDMDRHLKRLQKDLRIAIRYLKENANAKGNESEQPCES